MHLLFWYYLLVMVYWLVNYGFFIAWWPGVFELGIHWLCKGFFLLGVFSPAAWPIHNLFFLGWNSWQVVFTKQPGCFSHRLHPFTWFQWWSIWCGFGSSFQSIQFHSKEKNLPSSVLKKNVGSNKAFLLKRNAGAESFRATLDYILISPQLEVRRLESVDQLVPLLVHAVSLPRCAEWMRKTYVKGESNGREM